MSVCVLLVAKSFIVQPSLLGNVQMWILLMKSCKIRNIRFVSFLSWKNVHEFFKVRTLFEQRAV